MRTALAILASATVVSITTLCPTENDKLTAWRKLEVSVEKLRPLVASTRFASTLDANAEACRLRIAEIDDALDARASSSDGIGAPWMWAPQYREELFALVNDVTPMLDELAQLAAQRRGLQPIPVQASLLRIRHRMNLFCAAALVEPDDNRARTRFEQAWEVATMEDDGGLTAFMIQSASAAIIASAVRQRSDRLGVHDEMLKQELTDAFHQAFSCEANIERSARGLVQLVDRKDRDSIDVWFVNTALNAARDVYATLTGAMSFEALRVRDEQRDLRLFLWNCDPEKRAVYERNLRL